MEALGEWGEVAPRGFEPGAGPLVEEPRRRRFSPALGRPPWDAAVSSWWSSSSRSSLTFVGPPLMERPPGILAEGGGPGMFIGPDERPMGGPTGMEEGTPP